MNVDDLLERLDYSGAPNFLDESRWDQAIEHAHVFRHTAEACRSPKVQGRFRGIYMVGMHSAGQRRATTPVVFVAQANDARAADRLHHIVWNQSVVPFLIVHTPEGVRLYTGFDYGSGKDAAADGSQRGILDAAIAFQDVAGKLEAFCAQRIDDGTLWAKWGRSIDPAKRVDVRLLENLHGIRDSLLKETGLDPPVAHALIGRFVYLRYLRDRGILTDSRLRSWNLDPGEVFGRGIRLVSFHTLLDKVDGWLNGSIFPLTRSGNRAPKAEHVQSVAAAMLGDDVISGQYHLNFKAYDFSHIPIELLSSIYEQFMAMEGRDREAGAYYTPLPLVNFVLGELDDLHPLRRGMRVLDPSCGSGAFLVQCYQLLIEKCRGEVGRRLAPAELRDLLTEHVFGLDSDGDACRVTEFSLALALLDQIPTEVLSRAHNFKLPPLHNKNIFEGDFFALKDQLPDAARGFDWIVGNPPWVRANADTVSHEKALNWMANNTKTSPVCGNQIAQAFAWEALAHLRPDGSGLAALVMPAMTLFEKQISFRKQFFANTDVKAVANLTNLREVLFKGRARLPAAVFFYGPRTGPVTEDVVVYSPLVLNQEANRPVASGERQAVWTITVDHSEVRRLPRDAIGTGDPLPWKTSLWGSLRDLRFLRAITSRLPTLGQVAAQHQLHVVEGVQLRNKSAKELEHLDTVTEVTGKPELMMSRLRKTQHLHSFPKRALEPVAEDRSYVRKGRGTLPLAGCRPPHVIVSAARTFSVYSDEFLVVPPRQIGIAGQPEDADLLRVLALYLGSRFVRYHQFFLSPQEGVRGGRSTLDALLQLPVPFVGTGRAALRPWLKLHRELVALSDKRWALEGRPDALVPEQVLRELAEKMDALEREVDDLSAEALGLQTQERWLVDDLVNVRLDLVDGKIGDNAAGQPSNEQLAEYSLALRDTLDVYLDRGEQFRHALTVVHEPRAGMVEVAFAPAAKPHPPLIEVANSEVGRKLHTMRTRIDRDSSQWLYFARNLVMYLDGKVFLSKPMQRFWWTRSQALADADRIIADLVTAGAAREPA
jgi:hypothetical protein